MRRSLEVSLLSTVLLLTALVTPARGRTGD